MIEVKINTAALEKALSAAPEQMKYAIVQASSRTAWDIHDALKAEIPKTFKSPTPYTQRALKVYEANRSKLFAEVNFRGRPADHYLQPEVYGGSRPLKIFEKQLGGFLVPYGIAPGEHGKGAPIDAYGNVSGPQILRMLSVLGKAERLSGYNMNRSAQSAKRKMRQLTGYKEFVPIEGRGIFERVPLPGKGVGRKKTAGLKPGVYQKGKGGQPVKATGLKLWFKQVRKQPTYKPILKFFEVARKVAAERLIPNTEKAVSMALRRAGFK